MNAQFQYSYDSVKLEAVKQHEVMLMSIHKFFMDGIKRGWMIVSSKENEYAELNTITIEIQKTFRPEIVKNTLEAMNTTAYYACYPERMAEEYELAAKSM